MARPTVRTISRYLLRQHCAPLGFALAVLTSLMLLNQIAKQFGSLVGKGLPWSVILEVFVLSVPFIVAVTLPMAVLVAVLHVFTLKEQVINEVVPGQFFLRAARIDPNSNKLKDVTIYDLGDAERRRIIGADSGRMAYTPGGRDLYLTLEDGDIQAVNRTDPTEVDRTFFRINRMRVAGIGNTLERTEHDTYKSDREMSICEMRGMVALARREADRAGVDADVAVQNDLRRLAGLVPVYPAPPPYVSDTAPVGLYCRALRRAAAWLAPKAAAAQTPTPRPAPPRRLPQRPTEHPPFGPPRVPPPGAVPEAQTRPSLITPAATIGEEQRRRSAEQRAAQYEVEIQKKYAIAAACIVFALVGAPAALRYYRGGVGLVIGLSVAVFTVYYVGLIGGENLGDRLVVGPFFSMWLPNLLCAVVGVLGVWRIRKPGNTR